MLNARTSWIPVVFLGLCVMFGAGNVLGSGGGVDIYPDDDGDDNSSDGFHGGGLGIEPDMDPDDYQLVAIHPDEPLNVVQVDPGSAGIRLNANEPIRLSELKGQNGPSMGPIAVDLVMHGSYLSVATDDTAVRDFDVGLGGRFTVTDNEPHDGASLTLVAAAHRRGLLVAWIGDNVENGSDLSSFDRADTPIVIPLPEGVVNLTELRELARDLLAGDGVDITLALVGLAPQGGLSISWASFSPDDELAIFEVQTD